MLLHLFSSRTRVKLLSLFLLDENRSYFVRELTRLTDEQINSVRRELDNLESSGILVFKNENNKKFYSINKDFLIFEELKTIFTKLADDKYELIKGLSEYIDLQLLALSENLNEKSLFPTTFVMVGNSKNKTRIREFIHDLEEKYGKTIDYVIFTPQEFHLRNSYHDKFLTDFFRHQPIMVVDKCKYSW